MRSLAAWGTRPVKYSDGSVLHIQMEGGIGIDYNETTKEFKVAVSYRARKDPNAFTKKETYRRLNTKLDVGLPSTLLWKGTWIGDADKVKTELFATLTRWFKGAIVASLKEGKFDDNGNLIHVFRGPDAVPITNTMVVAWLTINEKASGKLSFSDARFIGSRSSKINDDVLIDRSLASAHATGLAVQEEVHNALTGVISADQLFRIVG